MIIPKYCIVSFEAFSRKFIILPKKNPIVKNHCDPLDTWIMNNSQIDTS